MTLPSSLVFFLAVSFGIPDLFSFWLKLVSMESIRGVNVPMYTTLRRTTVAFTMVVEYFLTGQRYSLPVVGR